MNVPLATPGPAPGTTAVGEAEALLRVAHVGKRYGAVQVLDDVSFAISPGTVTGLVGENGAGKSTLIKVLAGAVAPTSGSVELGGAPIGSSTRAVIDAGLSVIYQELTDVPDMSLLDNLLLGNPASTAGLRKPATDRARASAGLRRVGLGHLDLGSPIRNLTIAQRQLAEIARCLIREARVLILDEPTSSLPENDVETLMGVVEQLRDEGIAIIYVTHHLDELFRIADRLIVLRDGRKVAERPVGEWTEESLVTAMLARELEQAYPYRERPVGPVVMEAEGVEARGVRGAVLSARAGEIVGLVGLAGAGRSELMQALSGVVPATGDVRVDGRRMRLGSLASARRCRVLYAPEDRKRDGLILEGSIQANLTYGQYQAVSRLGFLRTKAISRRAVELGAKYGIKYRSPAQAVGELSGGNQQKVMVARVSELRPRVVFFDDPTRGVDVGAKAGIWEHVFSLAETGAAVFVCSSDTDEVLSTADRVYVIRSGRIVGELQRDHFDRERILHLASSGSAQNGDGDEPAH